MRIERQKQERGNLSHALKQQGSFSAELPLTIGLKSTETSYKSTCIQLFPICLQPPTPGFSLSHLPALNSFCCTNLAPSSPALLPLKQPLSAISHSLHSPSSTFPLATLTPCLAHTACFLSHRRRHQSHSLIASVWCCCGQGGRQAAAGEGVGSSDCLQFPTAELIFSSPPLHPCNPVSCREDSKLTDYVD